MYYVITQGSYSDYRIIAVTSNKEKANLIAERTSSEWDESVIEEYEEAKISQYPMWRVNFNGSGSVSSCEKETMLENLIENVWLVKSGIVVCVEARDEKSAIKIASEKRAEYLAEKNGL